jgi:NDP-4-keto-2,6-dideoxyhexose 3-C-methyltransferase
MRIAALEAMEFVHDLNSPEVWYEFRDKVEQLRRQVVGFIAAERAKGKSVWAYGASTKGNTLLQYFGLDRTMIDGIAERSPYKFGLRTVGTDIPIVSEDEMRAADPDYLLMLPWHFVNEFVRRERAYLEGGGQFIVPCPEFRVIGA